MFWQIFLHLNYRVRSSQYFVVLSRLIEKILWRKWDGVKKCHATEIAIFIFTPRSYKGWSSEKQHSPGPRKTVFRNGPTKKRVNNHQWRKWPYWKKQRELKRKRKIRGFPPEWMISGKYFQDLGPPPLLIWRFCVFSPIPLFCPLFPPCLIARNQPITSNLGS